MTSEYNDVMSTIGSTVQEDAESNTMASWVDSHLFNGVQDELANTYNLKLEFEEIADIMEENGIDFGRTDVNFSVADLIWESLQED